MHFEVIKMTELLLFLEFLFWLILRCGLLIILVWCAFDILDIIDALEEEHQNKNTASKGRHKLNEQ